MPLPRTSQHWVDPPCGVVPLPAPRRSVEICSLLLAVLARCKSETRAVSTASWAQDVECGKVPSPSRRRFVDTRAPASLKICAAATSKGCLPTPQDPRHGGTLHDNDQKMSSWRPHWQERRVRGRDRYNLLRKKIRNSWAPILVALDVGKTVKKKKKQTQKSLLKPGKSTVEVVQLWPNFVADEFVLILPACLLLPTSIQLIGFRFFVDDWEKF